MVLTDGDHTGHPAHGRPDERRTAGPQGVNDAQKVAYVCFLSIKTAWGPVGVTVTSGVVTDRQVAGLAEGLASALPRMAGLAASVQ